MAHRRRKKREWVTCLHDHSLAVVGSRAGIDAHFCLNELSIKWLRSQDLLCRRIMASAVKVGRFLMDKSVHDHICCCHFVLRLIDLSINGKVILMVVSLSQTSSSPK